MICSQCKTDITGARVVINTSWWCGDCAYLKDRPEAPRAKRERAKAATGQMELREPRFLEPGYGEIPY